MNNQFDKYNQNDIEKTNQPLLTWLREEINYCLKQNETLRNQYKKANNLLKVNNAFNKQNQLVKQQNSLNDLHTSQLDKFIDEYSLERELTRKTKKNQKIMSMNKQNNSHSLPIRQNQRDHFNKIDVIPQIQKNNNYRYDAMSNVSQTAKNTNSNMINIKIPAFDDLRNAQKQTLSEGYQNGIKIRNSIANIGQEAKKVGTDLGDPILKTIQEYQTLEEAMKKVAKQVKGLRDQQGQPTPLFMNMKEQIQAISETVPMSRGALDIADLLSFNATLGVTNKSDPLTEQHKQLINFTKVSAMASKVFDLPVEQVSKNLSEIAKLYNIPINNIEELTDTISFLEDNSQISASKIISVLQQMYNVADKLDFKQASALGSTFLNLGTQTENAALATTAMIHELSTATTQSKQFQQALQQLGLDVNNIEQQMATNAIGTIKQVLAATQTLNNADQTKVLSNLFGAEISHDVINLTNNLGELDKQLNQVNNPKAIGSLKFKTEIENDSISSQFVLLKTTMSNISSSLGETLSQSFLEGLKGLREFMLGINDWINQHPIFVQTFMKIASVVAIASVALGVISMTLSQLMGPFILTRCLFGQLSFSLSDLLAKFGNSSGGIQALGKSLLTAAGSPIKTLGSAFTELGTTFSTVGASFLSNPIAIAITSIIAVALLIRKFWEPISAFFIGFWQGLSSAIAPVIQSFSFMAPIFNTIGDAISGIINWFSELLSPIELTGQEFEGVKSAGITFGTAVGNIIMLPIRLFEQLFDIVSSAWDLIISLPEKITDLPNKIGAIFTGENGLFSMFSHFGFDIIDGITNGIKNKWNALKETISTVGSSICNWFKDLLGINSPSRVFTQFGAYTIEGYQLGIEHNQAGTLHSMSNFANKINTSAPQINDNLITNRQNSLTRSAINTTMGPSQYYITVNSAPGMSEQELTNRIIQELDRREDQQQFYFRSSLRDIE